MSRLKRRKKVIGGRLLKPERQEVRFSTPEEVAMYRARKLKCEAIADIGCGLGFQAFAFAKECSKVIAVDIDAAKLKEAQSNAARLGISNIEFICGDALEPAIAQKLNGCSIIFLDSERPPESRARSLEELKPDIREFIRLYSKVTDKLCIEVPPHLKNIPLGCEREYVSLHGQLNRLNLYFGRLKEHDVSVVALPEGEKLFSSSAAAKEARSIVGYGYIYEINAAVVLAGLVAEAAGKEMLIYRTANKQYLVSGRFSRSPFFVPYRIIASCSNTTDAIRQELSKASAKAAVLHGSIPPESYSKMKRSLEQGLVGSKAVHLFLLGEICLLCEKC